jgi:hypothetical protein
MSIDKLCSLLARTAFLISGLLLVLAIVEKVVNVAGYTLIRMWDPPRMLELAATVMIFVIALLLRQIREDGRRSSG